MTALAHSAPEVTPAACLVLFRSGKDTSDIARLLNISPARASKLVWVARSREKGLPADFMGRRGVVMRIAP